MKNATETFKIQEIICFRMYELTHHKHLFHQLHIPLYPNINRHFPYDRTALTAPVKDLSSPKLHQLKKYEKGYCNIGNCGRRVTNFCFEGYL